MAIFGNLFGPDDEYKLSAEIIETLNAMDDRPWPTWGKAGKGITAHAIARLLKPFRTTAGVPIMPLDIKVDGRNFKGYRRDRLEDAVKRHIAPRGPEPPIRSAPPRHSSEINDLEGHGTAPEDATARTEIEPKPLKTRDTRGGADQTESPGGTGCMDDDARAVQWAIEQLEDLRQRGGRNRSAGP